MSVFDSNLQMTSYFNARENEQESGSESITDSTSKSLRKFVRLHSGMLILGVPFAIVAINISYTSQGSSAALARIIDHLDVHTIILGSIVKMLPAILLSTLITAVYILIVLNRVATKINYKNMVILGSSIGGIFLAIPITPVYYLTSAVVRSFLLIFIYYYFEVSEVVAIHKRRSAIELDHAKELLHHNGFSTVEMKVYKLQLMALNKEEARLERSHTLSNRRRVIASIIIPAMIILTLGLLVLDSPWLSTERIKVAGKPHQVVGILDESRDHVTVLHIGTSKVQRITRERVVSRNVCEYSNSWLDRSLISLVSGKNSTTAPCER